MKPSGRTRAHRSQEVARALGHLIVTSSEDSFEELESKFRALETQLLSATSSPVERREIRRRVAERLLSEAFARNCAWPLFGQVLRRLQRLGYSAVDRRYQMATFYALWCGRHPEHDSRQARRLLDDVESRIRRLPRGNIARREMLRGLANVRAQTGLLGPAPTPR